MAVSGLTFCRIGSILTRLVRGLIFSLSGDGVYICGMHDVGGGVSLKVSLFLGEVLILEFGKSNLDPLLWDIAASLARCICCLRGVWFISGEKVRGTCRLPLAWITISSGDPFWPNESSKFPESLRLSGINGSLATLLMLLSGLLLVVLSTWLVVVGVAVFCAGLRMWLVVCVRVVKVGLLLILISSRANIPRCACVSCRTLVVLLVVGERGLNSLNRAWSSIFFFLNCFLH